MTLPDKLLNKKMINTTHEMWVNEKIPLQWTMPLETTNLEQAQELITEIIKRYNNYIELETKALLWDEHDIAYCTKKSQYKLLEQENKELKTTIQLMNQQIANELNHLQQYNKLRDAIKELKNTVYTVLNHGKHINSVILYDELQSILDSVESEE